MTEVRGIIGVVWPIAVVIDRRAHHIIGRYARFVEFCITESRICGTPSLLVTFIYLMSHTLSCVL